MSADDESNGSPPPSEARPPSDAPPDAPVHREPWLRFALTFGAIVTILEVLYHAVALESAVFQHFVHGLAVATGFVLEPFFEFVRVDHARVATDAFVVTVDYGCDGLQVCTLLSAAILAFPATPLQKLTGLVLGNLWLQAWNVVRIATLVVIGGIHEPAFEPTHVYVWPTLLILLCLATWMAWARWTMRDDEPAPRPADAAA